MERHVLFSNNSTFTPSCLSIVVLLLVTHAPAAPRRANGIEVILCSGSPGPNLKSLACQFSQAAVIFPTFAFNIIPRVESCGAVCSVINGSKERHAFVFGIKIHQTFVFFVFFFPAQGLNF